MPERKKRDGISSDVIDNVVSFFEDDEYSRIMPGKKDFISISRNVHKQKRLLLCNLKELYAMFKLRYSTVKIGFSKFCTIRPKWCIMVDSSGSHSVCICAIHQNVKFAKLKRFLLFLLVFIFS